MKLPYKFYNTSKPSNVDILLRLLHIVHTPVEAAENCTYATKHVNKLHPGKTQVSYSDSVTVDSHQANPSLVRKILKIL